MENTKSRTRWCMEVEIQEKWVNEITVLHEVRSFRALLIQCFRNIPKEPRKFFSYFEMIPLSRCRKDDRNNPRFVVIAEFRRDIHGLQGRNFSDLFDDSISETTTQGKWVYAFGRWQSFRKYKVWIADRWIYVYTYQAGLFRNTVFVRSYKSFPEPNVISLSEYFLRDSIFG